MVAKRKAKERKPVVKDRQGMIKRELTAKEFKTKSEDLANIVRTRQQLAEEKADHNRGVNAKLRDYDDQIALLAEEVDNNACWEEPQLALV